MQLFDLGKPGDRQELANQDHHQRQHGDGSHAGGQPTQPLGAREQIANELIGPQADGQRNQHPERAEEDGAKQ